MSTNRETGVYSHTNNRVHETRGLQQIDKFWGDLGMGGIDTQFSHQLDLAIAQKRSEINFLDFGSGEDATLLKQIVGEIGHRDTDYLVRTGTLLSEHPDLRLNMIGLTDALSPETFLQRELILGETEGQVMSKNVQYSITPEQPVEEFLEDVGTTELDLVAATMSFTYLGIEVFENSARTLISALRPGGGRLIAVGFPSGDKAISQTRQIVAHTYGEEFASSDEGIILRKKIMGRMIQDDADLGEMHNRRDILKEIAKESIHDVEVKFNQVSFVVTKN